jgi:trigger factor
VAESSRREVAIEIPVDVVQKKLAAVAAEFQRHAKLPGFRPGKAPLSVVRRHFEQDIRAQLLHDLLPEYVEAEVKQRKWDAVGAPAVTDIEYAEDAPIKFKAIVEVMPDFALGDYRSLTVEVEDPVVTDDEVDKTLTQLREQQASYTNVEPPRPIQDGDFASISVRGVAPGNEKAGVDLKEVLCEVGGADTVAEFTQNLRGLELGQEARFDVVYRPDHKDGRLAGKTIAYEIKVLGIKQKQLPALDDEFAKEMGEFETLEALRSRVRENMDASRREQAEAEAKQTLRKKLAEQHDFSVPDVLVDRQIERRVERLKRHLASQGMNPETLAWDWGKVRDSQRAEAVEEVKASLLLERIADAEGVEVAEEEIDREVAQVAKAVNQPEPALRARLTSDGGLDRIKSRLRIEKALEVVFQNAKVKSLGAAR